MQVTQSGLPSQSSGVTPSSMTNEIPHTELCQWLKAVAISRDKAAFTHLFRFFAPKIQRITKKKLNTDAQANEVVQETMSNVWRKAHLFNEDKGAATTWVYTIMRNVTFDMLRKVQSNKEDNLSEDIWPIVENTNIEEDAFADHLENKQLLSVIKELPENQQQVVKGFYFMEMSQEQLASHLNLPLGTVKSRLRLALAKLKIQLGDNHD
jgi:RNA polymerase sigma-70 factor (ECF subfamily)